MGNHKKGVSTAAGCSVPRKKAIPMRLKSGRDVFVSQVMTGELE